MNTEQMKLFGALIGYVRATEGDMDKISEEADVLVRTAAGLCGAAMVPGAVLQNLTERVTEEKFALVPGCRQCANPCERTAAYDLRLFDTMDPGRAALKKQMVKEVQRLSQRECQEKELIFYQGMFAIGDESYSDAQLQQLLDELKKTI